MAAGVCGQEQNKTRRPRAGPSERSAGRAKRVKFPFTCSHAQDGRTRSGAFCVFWLWRGFVVLRTLWALQDHNGGGRLGLWGGRSEPFMVRNKTKRARPRAGRLSVLQGERSESNFHLPAATRKTDGRGRERFVFVFRAVSFRRLNAMGIERP